MRNAIRGMHTDASAGGGRRTLLACLVLAVAFVAGLIYGMVVVETGIFPHALVRRASDLVKSRVGRVASGAATPREHLPGADGRGPGRELTEEEEREVMRLVTLGYVSGSVPAPKENGVRVHDPAAAFGGLNLYTSAQASYACLLDMEGEVLHTWGKPLTDVWPDHEGPVDDAEHRFWRRAHVFENGDLLAIYENVGIVKIDSESRLIWSRAARNHHDLEVLEDGTIYVLEGEYRIVPWIDARRPVAEDYVAVLNPDGTLRKRFSLLDAFVRSPYAPVLEGMPEWGDIMHTNTLEVLDGKYEHVHPAFRRGNLLLSMRQTNVVAVVDPDKEEVVWALTGRWRLQHQPTLVEGGHILLFNNLAQSGEASEVIEIDPRTQEVLWRYPHESGIPFFSRVCGSNQRLPNGNTLITESDNGRAIEVTADGRVVWEFVSPHRAGENDELVATLYEMLRLPPDFPLGWLPGRTEPRED